MFRTRPRYAAYPVGTTDAPAFDVIPPEDVPPPREDARLVCNLDWEWFRSVIEDGAAVAIVVDHEDMRALIDTVQGRLGYDLVLRISDDDVLWVFRPWALAEIT